MSNRTLLEELSLIPSTSEGSGADDQFPVPVDPFVVEDGSDYVNITGHDVMNDSDYTTNGTSGDWPDWQDVKAFFELNELVLYVLLAAFIIVVVVVILSILFWICKHKKRLINSQADPILTSTYDQDLGFRCCCCCRTSSKEASRNEINRQNSASNLEAYGRRDPLPDEAYKHPSHDVMKAQSTTFMPTITTEPIDDRSLGVYIHGIKDIPTRNIPQSEFRELPPLRIPRTNVYQGYQT